MLKTLQSLKQVATLYTGDTTDLTFAIMEYQDTQDPSIFAYVFTRNFGMLYASSQKYFNITEQDKVSFILEEVHKTLMDYDPSYNTKFITVLSTYVNRRLYAVTKQAGTNKRKANNAITSYDEISLQAPELCTVDRISEATFSEVELLQSLPLSKLSPNELAFCHIALQEDKLSHRAIARLLHITPTGVNYIRSSVAKKLGYAV